MGCALDAFDPPPAVDVLLNCPVLFAFEKERKAKLAAEEKEAKKLDSVALGQVQMIFSQCDSGAHHGICERPKSERYFAVALQGTSMVPRKSFFFLAGVVSRTCVG